MAGISNRRKTLQEAQDPLKVAWSPDLVIVLFEPFQAYLVIERLADDRQFLEFLLGHRVPQHHAAEPQVNGSLVKFKEIGVQEGIAAGERDLAADPPLAAEFLDLPQDLQPLGQGRNAPGAAVIAVPAVQVAGLRQMPLQGENLGGVKFVRDFQTRSKAGRIPAQGRGRRQNQTAAASLPQRRVNGG